MQLEKSANTIFVQLTDSIIRLSPQHYQQPCKSLFNNTIGQHVRHIIELFQCLENGYGCGLVNYDQRKRDQEIETDQLLACALLKDISLNLPKSNKDLLLLANFDEHTDAVLEISTNYYREVAYNLEHAIHHMALMRVGITEVSSITLSDSFGMASSTIKHRNQCAQ
ncbi:MAG TPA: hypothetical protein VK543_04255 [Puia sp.]|nr:hypothetical protein [Puia sp.]